MHITIIGLLLTLFTTCLTAQNKTDNVDLVIYTYNRPLQLYSLLESIYKHCTGFGEIHVICRITEDIYTAPYKDILKTFPAVIFHQDHSHREFFNFLVESAFKSPHDYVSFIVDDIIVKDRIDFSHCINYLESTNAYAFYLRLGLNITECYMQKKKTPTPPGHVINNEIYQWKFSDAQGDWAFPNNNDMTIYRKKDIKDQICSIDPNLGAFFESKWNQYAPLQRNGICFTESKIVNVTINTVYDANMWQFSTEWKQKMHEFSPKELCKYFMDGKKIDINSLYRFNNNAPHMEWTPIFKDR